MNKREIAKARSNNEENPNQNACGLAIAKALNVHNNSRYLHTLEDLVRASRKRWLVRSCKSSVRGNTVGAIRKNLENVDGFAFIAHVENHVLLLDSKGNTIVDTAPRKKDKRKVLHLFRVDLPAHLKPHQRKCNRLIQTLN